MPACAIEMCMDISQEPLYARINTKKVRGPRPGQPRYLRACAVKMHMAISQEPSLENLQEKCRAPRPGQHPYPHLARACAIEMHMDISKEHFYARICGKKAGAQKLAAHFLQACTVDMQWTSDKSHFMREFPGKMPRLKTRKNSRRRPCRLCASLHNQNGHGHLTRAILCENLKNAATQMEHPSNPGLYSYRKNPSVWTHVDTCGHTIWGKVRFDPSLCVFNGNQTPGRKACVAPTAETKGISNCHSKTRLRTPQKPCRDPGSLDLLRHL